MQLNIIQERLGTQQKIDFSGSTLKELLQELKLNSETVIIVRNQEIITEDENLENNDTLEILSVISGG